MRRTPLVLAAVAAVALAAPAGAGAHAVLESTKPVRGAELESAPEAVSFAFNEPVEATFGAVRVYDRTGERVDAGELIRPGGAETVGVALEPGLDDGIYTATYRVISADSHPVSGGFVFTVGEAGGPPALGVEELIDSAGAGPVTEAALGTARAVSYVATALAIGGVAFLLLAWAPALAALAGGGAGWATAAERFAARLRRLLVVAVVAGAAATVAGIVLQGAVGLGTSAWDALRPAVIGDVLATKFGTVWGLRLLDFLLLAGLLLVPRVGLRPRVIVPARLGAAGNAVADPLPSNPVSVLALGLGLGFLALAPGLAGHAGVTDPTWLLVPTNFAHVLAFAAWAGGLVAIAVALPAATRALEGAEKTRLLAAVISRFSALALAAVATLIATGTVQSLFELGAWDDFIDTGFGRAVLVKIGLLCGLVALGAINRQRVRPRLDEVARGGATPGAAGALLRRTIRAELALIGGVLAATAVLAALAPPADTAAGPVSVSAELGEAQAEVTVDPAVAGSNEVHLYLFDREDGSQYDAAKEVRVDAELADEDVGPIALELRKAGPGHFVTREAQLGIAGEWTLELSVRVSAFERQSAAIEVAIR